MIDPAVIVFEQRPHWTPELQRQFIGQGIGVLACPSVADVSSSAQKVSRAAIILDLQAAPADVLRFLESRIGIEAAQSSIVVANDRWAELEWRIRELGALDVLFGHVSGLEMANLCRRQWNAGQAGRRQPLMTTR